MVSVFAKNQPLVMVFLPIILVAHLICSLYFSFFDIEANIDPNLFFVSFHFNALFGHLLAISFVFLNAYLINTIFNSHQFFSRYTYLPSYFYCLLSLCFPYSVYLTGDSFAHTFLILILLQLYKIVQNQSAKSYAFNIGIFFSLGIICNPLYTIFLVAILVSFNMLRSFLLREYVLFFVGVFIPFLYLFIFLPNFYDNVITFIAAKQFIGNLGWIYLGILLLCCLLLFISLIGLAKYSKTSSIRFKKIRTVVLWFLFFGFCGSILAVLFKGSVFYFALLVVPACLLLPYGFLGLRINRLINALTWILLLVSFAKFYF